MKFKTLVIGVTSATLLAGAASAHTISALDDLGNVYNLSIATDGSGATATLVTSVPDPATLSGRDTFSPNALGVDDTVITTMTFATPGDETITVQGSVSGSQTVSTTQFAVAAGDSEGGIYYYVDGDLNLYSVAGNGTGAVSFVADLSPTPSVGTTLGDLAIIGDDAFLSFGSGATQSFTTFSLSDVAGTYTIFTPVTRFVGLGVDGDDLFGLEADGGIFKWTGGGSFIAFGETTGLIGTQFTDASSAVIPLPAAGWMLLAGLGGLAALKRRRKAA